MGVEEGVDVDGAVDVLDGASVLSVRGCAEDRSGFDMLVLG